MSHATVTVCLPPTPPDDVYDALRAAMEPYDMGSATNGGKGVWDSWHIDRELVQFPVKPEHDGDPRLVYADRWEGWPDRQRLPLNCDGGPVGLLDLSRMRGDAIAEAWNTWQWQLTDWNRLVAEYPPALPLTAFLARHHADPRGYTRDQAIADHHGQPLIKALSRNSIWTTLRGVGQWVLGPDSDPIAHFARDLQPDLDLAAQWAIATFAILTLDGLWIDPDTPGPWREDLPDADKTDRYTHQHAVHAREATRYIEELNGDCVIVRLYYHC